MVAFIHRYRASADAKPDYPSLLKPEVMIGNSQEKFDDQGNLTDDVTRTLITRLLQSLVQKARAHRRSRSGPRPSPLARGDKHRA